MPPLPQNDEGSTHEKLDFKLHFSCTSYLVTTPCYRCAVPTSLLLPLVAQLAGRHPWPEAGGPSLPLAQEVGPGERPPARAPWQIHASWPRRQTGSLLVPEARGRDGGSAGLDAFRATLVGVQMPSSPPVLTRSSLCVSAS